MTTKNERFYISLHAGKKIAFRNIIRKKAGKLEPMIQVEYLDNSKRSSIIRCDKKPGIGLHLDMYNKDGVKVVSHQKLSSQTPKEAIVEIIDMLNEESEHLLNKLGFSVKELPSNWKAELENAKKFLLAQVEYPEKIVGKSGTTALGYEVSVIIADRVSAKKIKGKKKE